MRGTLAHATAVLSEAGVDTPRADAEWLLAGVLGVRRGALALGLDSPIPGDIATRYRDAVRRRAAREPLQQILGWEEFRGLRLQVTPEVLVPRPETEMLVEWALELLGGGRAVVDVGTGSGCVACAIAVERPAVRVVAVDLSPAAAAVARGNARALGLAGRVSIVVGDGLGSLRGPADLVVANLPYLPTGMLAVVSPEVGLHEPRLALDGGADGLAVIGRLVDQVADVLAPGGAVALETAGDAQAAATAALLRGAGLTEVRTRADLAGVPRFVAGRRAEVVACHRA